MRKFVLWLTVLSLVIMPCAAFGLTTNPFSEFGIRRTYTPNSNVSLNASSDLYYGGIKSFESKPEDFYFVGKTNSKQSNVRLPQGTLILAEDSSNTSSGKHDQLFPSSIYSKKTSFDVNDLIPYDFYEEKTKLYGKRVMWNLATSPDVLVGSYKIPNKGDVVSKSIATDEIVPYVKIAMGEDTSLDVIEVSFRKLNALGTVLDSSGVKDVKISFSGEEKNFSGKFTGTQTIEVNRTYHDIPSIVVSYYNNGDKYSWTFNNDIFKNIDFGDLALDKMPVNIPVGESKTFTIGFPSYISLPSASEFGYAVAVNDKVLTISDVKVSKGTLNTPSTATFKATGAANGRTTLKLCIPNFGDFIREIEVGIPATSGTNSTGLKANIYVYMSTVKRLEEKPYYPSAKFDGVNFSIDGTGVNAEKAYLGVKKGTVSEIFALLRPETDRTKFYLYAVSSKYDTANAKNSKDFVGNIDFEDFTDAKMWWEFEGDSRKNLACAPLEFSNTSYVMNTAKQLENFVPCFEREYDKQDGEYKYNWYFVKVSGNTLTKVTPTGITDIVINEIDPNVGMSQPADGTTSGSCSFDINNIRYTCNNMTYRWEFGDEIEMDYDDRYFDDPDTSYTVKPGESVTVKENLKNISELNSVNIVILNENVVSVTPTTLTPADTISFTLTGKTEGSTGINFVFEKKNVADGEEKFVWKTRGVNVSNNTTTTNDDTISKYEGESSDIKVTKICAAELYGYIAGNEPYYYTRMNDDKKYVSFQFEREDTIEVAQESEIDDMERQGIFNGKIYMYKNNSVIDSGDIRWSYKNIVSDVTDEEGNTTVTAKIKFRSDQLLLGDKITWEFPSGVNTSGSYTLSVKDILSPSEQKTSVHPYVKLNKKGLNIDSFEWSFVDADNNKVSSLSDISSVDVNFNIHGYGEAKYYLDNETLLKTLKTTTGTVAINVPGNILENISVEYVKNGVTYTSYFQPVSENSSSGENNLFTWDTASNDLPLVMYVGDTKTITLKAASMDSPVVFVGNSDVLGVETLSTSGMSVKTKLTAKAAGMTTITLGSSTSSQVATPREVWVAALNSSTGKYEIPNLTTDVAAFMTTLAEKTFVYNGSDAVSQNTSNPTNENSNGTTQGMRKVESKIVAPKSSKRDLTSDTVKKEIRDIMKTYLSSLGSILDSADIFDINDTTAVEISSNDIDRASVASDVQSRHGHQAAAILGHFKVKKPGIFVFIVDDLSMLDAGMNIYWHAMRMLSNSSESVESSADSDDDNAVFLDANGKETSVVSSDKQVEIFAYMTSADYTPVVAADSEGSTGGSGGGCNSGISILALTLGLYLVRRKK
ncbi:MAG: hypothetical protein IJP69_03345 [Synergistaceae bacterium]|nr:hypothetical protein [Synergistaceae bacterium]